MLNSDLKSHEKMMLLSKFIPSYFIAQDIITVELLFSDQIDQCLEGTKFAL